MAEFKKTEVGKIKTTVKVEDPKFTKKALISSKKFTPIERDVWYSEKGTFVTGGAINLRYGARTSSKIIAQFPAGTEVKYDAYSRHGGYVWIRQPRSNGYGYLVCRAGNEEWGTFK